MNLGIASCVGVLLVLWALTVFFIYRKAVSVASMPKACRNLEASGLMKNEWKPFIRFESKGAVIPSRSSIFFRSAVFGPFKFWMSITYLFVAFLASLSLPKRGVAAVARWVSRSILSTVGIHVVQHGNRASSAEAPLLVSNHISAMDMLAVLSLGGSFVANDGVKRLPCVGSVAAAIGCIFVGRDSATSRSAAKEAVSQRLRAMMDGSSPETSQLVVFPEGTTTNGLGVLEFRRGSFESAVPVQPVRIGYSNLQCSMAMVDIFQLLSYLSVLPRSEMTVQYFPVVKPSIGESPEALAARCRVVIKGDALEEYGLQTHRDEIDLLAFLKSEQCRRDAKKSN